MGNCTSQCKEDCSCLSWLYKKKKVNLPTKPQVQDRPKPIPPPTPGQDEAPDRVLIVPESGSAPLGVGVVTDYLTLTKWNWLIENNGVNHHTSEYSIMEGIEDDGEDKDGVECTKKVSPKLVIRRGQTFLVTIDTNRRYNPSNDKLSVVLTVADAKKPNFGNGTMIGMKVREASHEHDPEQSWSCITTNIKDSSVTLQIQSPPNAVIGEWKFEIDIESGRRTHNFPAPSTFFLLFNPWCEGDTVYISGEAERKEYVTSDFGMIWRGTHSRVRPCAWKYAHHDPDVLLCILYVLSEVCRLVPAHRSDPVKVARAISAGINSPNDDGVLVGNWSGEYKGGVTPTDWSGSKNILKIFYKNKKSVKYGQCWVFSGVVTTACRALGLPCRPITNFSSAHDTHNSLTIDYFFDEEGEEIERLNADSVWNFHVWNEVWMTRPDLGSEYNGWQVIDATPQEESDGEYRCGPASLVAIKRGEIHKSFDVPFVFAEVNADKLFWRYRGPNCPMKLIGRKTEGVGLKLSTKAVGRWIREDVTELYKHEEESTAERCVMKDALRRCENVFARYYLNQELEDVMFDFKLIDDIIIGKPFNVSVTVCNKGTCNYDVSVKLRADAVLYTGAVKGNVKKEAFNVSVKPQSTEELTMCVCFTEYYPKLVDQCAMNIACLAMVKQTEFEYFSQDDFRVRKPDINIKVDGDFIVGKDTKCTASFHNPLPMVLKRPLFYVLSNKAKSVYMRVKQPVTIDGEAKCEFVLTPKSVGEMTVNVSFISDELEDVDGFETYNVLSATTQPNGDTTITTVT